MVYSRGVWHGTIRMLRWVLSVFAWLLVSQAFNSFTIVEGPFCIFLHLAVMSESNGGQPASDTRCDSSAPSLIRGR